MYWNFPLIILCQTGLVDRCCLHLVLSWNILVSPYRLIENFAGYSNLDWYSCSFRDCMTSDQVLLTRIVSVEMSRVILIGLSLFVTWPFSLASFYSLFCVFKVFIIM